MKISTLSQITCLLRKPEILEYYQNHLYLSNEASIYTSKGAKIAKCSTDTALRDIQNLVEKNILEKEPGEGRNTSYKLNLKFLSRADGSTL